MYTKEQLLPQFCIHRPAYTDLGRHYLVLHYEYDYGTKIFLAKTKEGLRKAFDASCADTSRRGVPDKIDYVGAIDIVNPPQKIRDAQADHEFEAWKYSLMSSLRYRIKEYLKYVPNAQIDIIERCQCEEEYCDKCEGDSVKFKDPDGFFFANYEKLAAWSTYNPHLDRQNSPVGWNATEHVADPNRPLYCLRSGGGYKGAGVEEVEPDFNYGGADIVAFFHQVDEDCSDLLQYFNWVIEDYKKRVEEFKKKNEDNFKNGRERHRLHVIETVEALIDVKKP